MSREVLAIVSVDIRVFIVISSPEPIESPVMINNPPAIQPSANLTQAPITNPDRNTTNDVATKKYRMFMSMLIHSPKLKLPVENGLN